MSERRRGAVRSESARVAILAATAELFAERGYEHLSIEGIASRAGVAKQTVYRWWPGKSALVADCLIEGMLLGDTAALPDTGSLRGDLAEWLRGVIAVLEGPSGEGLFRSLIAAATDNADVGRRLREGVADPGLVADRIRAAIADGEVRADLPVDDVAEVLVGSLMVRALTRSPADPGLPERLVDLLLGPRPA